MDVDPGALAAACERRTDQLVEALGALAEPALLAPSSLPGWSQLTIVCHLRYGAEALGAMTEATLAGRPASYYPEGRATQRPGTLEPRPGERPGDAVESLAAASASLHERWRALDARQWDLGLTEPPDNPDLGPMPLATLALLRLTEVEVHGTDLALGLPDWSDVFVQAALPLRVARLWTRQRAGNATDGSWLLVAEDGPAHLVVVRDGALTEAGPADPGATATARIEATSRDLVALLLGRPTRRPLRFAGDSDLARAFTSAFPGP